MKKLVQAIIKQNDVNYILVLNSSLNYYVIVLILNCKTLRWDTGEVRDRFGGMSRFKVGLRCKGWVNSVIINVITEINYGCNYMQVFFLYKYNGKTCIELLI